MADKIKIKDSRKGTFGKKAKEMGMSTKEAASHILAHKDNYSPSMVKKANFSKNFSGKKWDGGNINNQYGLMPSGQIGYNPTLKSYGTGNMPSLLPNGFIPSNYERTQELLEDTGYHDKMLSQYQPQQSSTRSNTTEYSGMQAALSFGALGIAGEMVANGIDQGRQQDYISRQDDPYSNLTPLSGQSYGVKYGYQKYGGFLKKKKMAEGGDTDNDFDPTDFLWGDDKSSTPIVSESDVQQAVDQKGLRKQRQLSRNQQIMAAVEAPYTNTSPAKSDTNRSYMSTNPDSTASYNDNIAAGESGGNYMAKNPTSTAFGKYQFVKNTRMGVYDKSKALQNLFKNREDFENAFTGKLGEDKAMQAQEQTMTDYTAMGAPIHKNDPVAMALYHYAPKFADMYIKGKLDLDKNAASYGIGSGVKNPTFRQFLRTHGFKGQFKEGGKV